MRKRNSYRKVYVNKQFNSLIVVKLFVYYV
nr:MAG TPA: hypothetical protein [Crassvirales sp.]